MSQGNAVLALYAAFAGFLLILGAAYKVWTEHEENRKAPRLNFKSQARRKEDVREDRGMVVRG
jgi:hypothetical protein